MPSNWGRDNAAVLGIVTDSQIAYTRAGANLALNPPLTHAEDKSTIPYYNVYWSDSWHMKPSFTLTYGLGWTLEMPPTEQLGRQIELVDQAGQQLSLSCLMNSRKAAALQGQVYNPTVGFALVGNTGGGQKYPYSPTMVPSARALPLRGTPPSVTAGWVKCSVETNQLSVAATAASTGV